MAGGRHHRNRPPGERHSVKTAPSGFIGVVFLPPNLPNPIKHLRPHAFVKDTSPGINFCPLIWQVTT